VFTNDKLQRNSHLPTPRRSCMTAPSGARFFQCESSFVTKSNTVGLPIRGAENSVRVHANTPCKV